MSLFEDFNDKVRELLGTKDVPNELIKLYRMSDPYASPEVIAYRIERNEGQNNVDEAYR